ncbi:MAG: glycosyltransferase family 4 protein [Bacillota bacterium]
MKRFTVLHVIRPAAGGMRCHLLNLLRYTDRNLFEPGVAGPPGEMLAAAAEVGAKVFPIPLQGELDLLRDARAVFQLSRVLRRERVNILHAHSAKAGLVGRLAALYARTPVVFFTVHNSIFYAEWPAYKRGFFALAEKMLARRTHRIITVSEALRRELIAREGLEPDQVVTVYNGVNPGEFQVAESREALRRRLGLPAEGPVVGTVTRLAPQKGLRYLIEAAALFPPEERPVFVVVGDGPLRAELQELAEKSGVSSRFVFTGVRRDVPQVLGALDLLVLPSVTEGLGLILLEAMAASLPVVATAVGGVPEVVLDGETGVLVPPRDPAALAGAIAGLLRAPERARRLGAAGRERVARLFTVERMVGQVSGLYREALAAQGFYSG